MQFRSLIPLAAVVSLSFIPNLRAVNYYWDPGQGSTLGGSGTWDTTTANWSPNTTGGSTIVWPNNNTSTPYFYNSGTVTVASGGVTANGLNFDNNNVANGVYTLSGGPINIATAAFQTGISFNATAANVTINSDITFTPGLSGAGTGNLSTYNNRANASLTLGNIISNAASGITGQIALSYNVDNLATPFTSSTQTVAGNITKTNASTLNLVVTGANLKSTTSGGLIAPLATAGTFVLAGANTGLNNVNITSGDVVLRNVAALGTATVTFSAGSTLTAGSYYAYETSLVTGVANLTIPNRIQINTDASANNTHSYTIGSNSSVTSGTTIFSGNISNSNAANGIYSQATNLVASAGATTRFSGVISGTAAVAAGGGGTISFTGTNTFTGALSVTNGTLSLDAAGTLNAATGTTTVGTGGILTSTVANANLGGAVAMTAGSISPNGTGVGALTLASTRTFAMSAGTLALNIASASLYDQINSAGGSAAFSITGGTLDLGLGTNNNPAIYSAQYNLLSGFAPGAISNLSISGYDTADYTATLSPAGTLSFTAVPEPSTWIGGAGALALAGTVLLRRRQRIG